MCRIFSPSTWDQPHFAIPDLAIQAFSRSRTRARTVPEASSKLVERAELSGKRCRKTKRERRLLSAEETSGARRPGEKDQLCRALRLGDAASPIHCTLAMENATTKGSAKTQQARAEQHQGTRFRYLREIVRDAAN